MHLRYLTFVGGLAVVLSLAQGRVAAQAQPVNAKAANAKVNEAWTPPRTVDGQPDLQGVWDNNNATPLQRPKVLEGRTTLTDEEVAALKKEAQKVFDSGETDAAFGDTYFQAVWDSLHQKKAFTSTDGKTGDYSSVWLVGRDWDNRTSLITDPPDGRIPPMTPEAQKRQATAQASFAAQASGNFHPAGPEELPLGVRCVTFGSPRLGAGYDSYYQIFQSRDSVAIEMELGHEVRIIPLDGSPHLPSTVQTWLGDSRGHWEGDTLVVDTTNYKPGASRNASATLHTIERFTRTGPETIQYEVTFDDPATWTKPWTVMIPLRHSKDAMYEYACQEGNYALADILRGARVQEAAEAAAKNGSR